MFGGVYFGQAPFGVTPQVETRGSGGGWAHRGPVTLPPRRRPYGLPTLPKIPKPPYLFYTEDVHGRQP